MQRYQKESLGHQESLFGFVQIFAISNGAHTKYNSSTKGAIKIKFL
nr:hypothetical protein [Helicobacter baculiformis]